MADLDSTAQRSNNIYMYIQLVCFRPLIDWRNDHGRDNGERYKLHCLRSWQLWDVKVILPVILGDTKNFERCVTFNTSIPGREESFWYLELSATSIYQNWNKKVPKVTVSDKSDLFDDNSLVTPNWDVSIRGRHFNYIRSHAKGFGAI